MFGAFRSLSACLRAPEKLQKRSACAGVQLVHAPLIQSILSNKGLLSAVVKCIFFGAVFSFIDLFFFVVFVFAATTAVVAFQLGSLWDR